MLEIISGFMLSYITYLLDCYAFCKIMNQKYKLEFKTLILICIASIINCYFQQNYNMTIRMIVTNLELICLLKLIYNKSIVKILIAVLITFLSYSISELIYALITISIIGIDQSILMNSIIGQVITNISILFITYILFQLKRPVKIFQTITNWYKDNHFINTIVLVIVAISTLSALLYPISVHTYSLQETMIFTIFLLCTIIFVTGFFTQKSKNGELSTEYDYLLDYVKVYEIELNDKAKKQHEYKNQLILLKDMTKTKKAIQYIDSLLKDETLEENVELLNSLQPLPDGGLKGLIYFKINNIQDENMEIHINISHELNNKKVWKTCTEQLNDVSKIVGIFLDNAIEALENESKKYLIIDIDYEDKTIIFSFSNTCTKHLDFSKMELEGYTTKGKNHGYGLPLVNDIVNSSPYLDTKKEINGQFFVQHLYIHQKK